MDQAYYLEYFSLERRHWWFRARAEILMGHLRGALGQTADALRVLNVGAATGRSAELLAQFGDVTSIEYDQSCCAFTRAKTGLELVRASVTQLPFRDGCFDLVCCFDVIEHVQDDGAAVNELQRVCRAGGLVSLTVPAFMFLWSRHDVVNHHCRRYTAPQLRRLVERCGSPPVFHSYFNFWLFPPIAGMRMLQTILPKNTSRTDAGSDFFAVQDALLDKLFYAIFRSEAPLVRWGVRLPFGVSILSTWRKPTEARQAIP
jgi:SAM-dependent methyltransferase